MKLINFGALIAGAFVILSIGTVAGQQQPQGPSGDESVAQAVLIVEAIKIMEGNIKASGRESGEIDKLIRALSGVSIKDIKQYGICGGPNSEVRKAFGSLCNKID
jgi:hypothetical protein